MAYFGVSGVNSLGLSVPQMRKLAKQIGVNHSLALKLWKTKIHEAQHIATMIVDPKLVTEKLMEQWLKDFNSWDLVDGTCSNVFRKTTWAYEKVKEWSTRKKEFEKRAAFSLICYLAVHDKKEADKPFEDLPTDAQNFINRHYNDYSVKAVRFFDDNEANDTNMNLYDKEFEDEDSYFVELQNDSRTIIVHVTLDGDVRFFRELK